MKFFSWSLKPMYINNTNRTEFKDWYANLNTNGGILPIDKDKDWTSFDVVAKIRNSLKIRKIGHCGTLDPLATGLLILFLSKATKLIDSVQNQNKVYTGTIKLGATTKSDDAEFEEENIKTLSNIIEQNVIDASKKFIGELKQQAPQFSAIKVKGKRMYKYARKDQKTILPIRFVSVYKFIINKIEFPFVNFTIECSKGTYIRSIARDLGIELGTGAYLYDLRRISIGSYNVSDAFKISEVLELSSNLNLINS